MHPIQLPWLVLRGREGLKLTQLGEQVVPLAAAVERAVNAIRDLVASQRSPPAEPGGTAVEEPDRGFAQAPAEVYVVPLALGGEIDEAGVGVAEEDAS